MGTGTTVFGWVGVHLARMLATRPASPVILVGSLAIAGLGAAAMNPAKIQQNPSPVGGTPALILNSPHTFCGPDPDGDGHTVCHVLASQMFTVPNLGCNTDPAGDGTFICWYATDPTAAN